MTPASVFEVVLRLAPRAPLAGAVVSMAVGLSVVGCGDDAGPAAMTAASTSPETATTTTGQGTGTGTGTTGSSDTTPDTSTPAESSSSSSGADTVGVAESSSTGGSGIDPLAVECSIWNQDCGEGERCRPWSNDMSEAWNAARCTPMDQTDAVQLEQPCIIDVFPRSGEDNCAFGLICVDLSGEEGLRCVPMCTGSAEEPACFGDILCTQDGTFAACIPASIE